MLAAASLSPPAAAEERKPRGPAPAEITPESREAIYRGCEFLKQQQKKNGSWEAGEHPVAITALCGLALLANGSTPTSGPYADQVRKAANYLVLQQLRSGMFRSAGDSRPMYGHGFALLFLAECYGMTGSWKAAKPVDRAIRDAVKIVSAAQSKDGGWYYDVNSGDEDEGSVTITQIQGLRAARNAGFRVEKGVIDRAIDYIRRSQDRDGGVRYTVRYGRSSLALTGAGLAVLFGAGDYDSDNVERGLKYVREHMETNAETPHFHYTHFYLAQALHQQGGTDWEGYFPQIRSELLRQRGGDGSWSSTYGRPYATALSLLILEIPFRYLPIYER